MKVNKTNMKSRLNVNFFILSKNVYRFKKVFY